jgi:uncharacterized protein (DUF58 family)
LRNRNVERHLAWSRIAVLFLLIGLIFDRFGLISLVGMMFAVFGIAWLWNRIAISEVRYDRKIQYRRAFPDERVDCVLEIENRKLLPLGWLVTEDRWPVSVGPEEEDIISTTQSPEVGVIRLILAMRWYHRIRRKIPLKFRTRGIFTLGPTRAISGDPFGVFETRKEIKGTQKLVVFPKVDQLEEIALNPEDPFGSARTTRRLFEDISRPMGVREYRPEDGFRRIHWPATARIGQLQTRVYQPISGLDLIVCLNIATFDPHWLGIKPKLMEALVSKAASIVYHTFNLGYRVGLISNGGIAYAGRAFRVPPGRSPKQLPILLEALAGVTPIVISPFSRFLISQAPNLEYGSTLIVVTGVMTEALTESLLRLKARARKIITVSLTEKKIPDIPGIEMIHQPFRTQDMVVE